MKGTLPETFYNYKAMTLDDVVCLKEEGARPPVADERNYVPLGSPSEPYQIIIIISNSICIVYTSWNVIAHCKA